MAAAGGRGVRGKSGIDGLGRAQIAPTIAAARPGAKMTSRYRNFLAATLVLALGVQTEAALAGSCRTNMSFDPWPDEFRREAAGSGISQRALAAAATGMVYDQRIVNIDRGQRVFNQTFIEFSGRMVAAYRIQRGGQLIQQYANVFARAQQQFGVPAP